MFLNKLIIENGNKVIRNISFKKGLNLILDKTPDKTTTTGNNVGKTTMIRVINYCLGGKVEGIYKDKETGTDNNTVKDFLHLPQTKIKLLLKGKSPNDTYEIIRSFNTRPLINGEEKTDTEFKQDLGRILFKLKSNKPSFREILGKFIRIENYQLENVYKFLHPSTPDSKSVYEYIYLCLFGFPDHRTFEEKNNMHKIIKK